MLIDNIRLFLTITEKGSLVAAGREAGLSTTTVSERLAALEAHYGVVLFNRTTRKLSLTDEGRTLLSGAKLVLGEIEDLETRIRHGADTLSGPIKVSAPIDIGRSIVSEVISRFTTENPAISIELLLSDGYVDIVGQGFDLALRFGTITDSTLRLRNLGHFRRIVCASPSYIDAHGAPQKPADLAQHNCLIMRFGTTLDNVWRFGTDKKPQTVTVRGNKTVNDGSLVRQWALEGCGIILKSELDVAPDMEAGRLVALLEGYAPPANPLQMMFPPGRAQPRRVRALATAIGNAMIARES
ncbi:LysR family transcriptional regulator [Marinovum sp. 2_MG-2023]|uniref:LysR family transcriptional regulator n=1 Tax=unclassified Marinovum TaxID=2647166 RepID=UPI0026E2584A|nr:MULTISPECIES: LysR family transcriptional regulator [unclassified Marinovum]MDO6732182.1 LysR family transcriptional regulator [Marinovum sp. 2_MG-2023]MDO6781499.1 LysR family transcriptional regulator [Marinovum sp. 1_MG-2023]